MAYTKYGDFIRIQRVKNHEVMGDLAKVLDASLPFMSAVENGKKNVPDDWINKIIDHYNLSNDESTELIIAVEESRTQVKINLSNANLIQREVAIQFQRSFEKMDDETANKIKKLLEGK
ncbi:MAG: XRE family transcriptional regulator [Bacilli bacterium]|nr:XRE family transcriptional regulator [Bacilli bacterium]